MRLQFASLYDRQKIVVWPNYALNLVILMLLLIHPGTASFSVERKACVNAVNTDGASPLHDALNRGEMSIVEELLEAGASTSIRPHAG